MEISGTPTNWRMSEERWISYLGNAHMAIRDQGKTVWRDAFSKTHNHTLKCQCENQLHINKQINGHAQKARNSNICLKGGGKPCRMARSGYQAHSH